MILEGDLAKVFIELAKEHMNHTVEFVFYGKTMEAAANFALECTTCDQTLIDADVDNEQPLQEDET